MTRIITLSVLLFLLFSVAAHGSGNPSTPTPIPGGNFMCTGATITLQDITIDEVFLNDFVVQPGSQDLILETNNGTFISGTESATIINPNDLNISVSVTSTQIIISLTETGNVNQDQLNHLIISGVQFTSNTSGTANITVSADGNLQTTSFPTGTLITTVVINDVTPSLNGNFNVCTGGSEMYSTESDMNNYFWTVSGGTISSGGSSSDNSVTVDWNSGGPGSVSVSYTTSQGCTSLTNNEPVTVNLPAIPTITPDVNNKDCSSASVTESYTTESGMSNYHWVIVNSPDDEGKSPNYQLDVHWPNAGTGSLTVSYTDANGCQAVSTPFTVDIHPSPVLVPIGSPTACAGIEKEFQIQGGNNTVTSNWAAGGASITGGTGGDGDTSLKATWPGPTFGEVSVDYSTADGCTGTADISIDVFNGVPIGHADEASGCSGFMIGYDLTSNVGSVAYQFSWGAIDNPSVTGETTSSTNPNIQETLVNTTSTDQAVSYTVTPSNGCGAGTPFTITLTIHPEPVGANSNTDVFCSGNSASHDLTTNMTNGNGVTSTFQWIAADNPDILGETTSDPASGNIINDALNNKSTDPQVVQYTVTPQSLADACNGAPFQVSIIVNPVPILTDPTSPDACSGTALNFNLGSRVSVPSTFSWLVNEDNPVVTGESTTPQTTDHITDLLTNTVASTQIVTYHITPTGTIGACLGNEFTLSFNIQAIPVGNADAFLICSRDGLNYDIYNHVASSSGVIPSSITWVAADNPNVSGESAGAQSSFYIQDALINKSTGNQVITYTITPFNNTCQGPDFTVSITTSPEPSGPDDSPIVCSGTAMNYDLQAHLTNNIPTTWSWQAVNDNPNVSGQTTSPQTTDHITDLLINATSNEEDIIYIVEPTSADGCAGNSMTITAKVDPLPSGTNASSAVCSDVAVTESLQTPISTVAVNANGLTQSGGTNSAGINKNAIELQDDTWTNTGLVPVNVIYTITPVSPAGCPGPQYTITETINPKPVLQVSASTICSSQAVGITLATDPASVAASTYSISTITPSAGLAGVAGNAATGTGKPASAIQNDQWNNSTVTPQTVSYDVTPTSSLACAGASGTIVVTVNPVPVVSVVNASPSFNSGGITNITLTSNVAGSTFAYSVAAAPEISGASAGTGASIAQLLANNSLNQKDAIYTITPSFGGCAGTQATATVTVIGARTIMVSDSVALVALYASSTGASWTSHTNWLTGKANTWYGVTVVNGLVKKINLDNNNLGGSLPPQIGTLAAMDTLVLSNNQVGGSIPSGISGLTALVLLDLSNNKLTGTVPSSLTSITTLKTVNLKNNLLTSLPDLTGWAITSVDVSKNSLTFESLEPNITLPTFTYVPQDSVGVQIDTLIQSQTPFTLLSSVGGTANQYQWKKDNTPIGGANASSYAIASPLFADEGTYLVEVTNTTVPGLTLVTRPVDVKVSSLKRDSLSLVQLYNSAGGNGWTNKTGWLTGKLDTWNGVVITGSRVTDLNLAGNNLVGIIPRQLRDILNLKTVNVSNNKLTRFPNVTSLTQLTSANISGNKLDFASLEPNAAVLSKINFTNQAALGTARRDSLATGTPVTLHIAVGGTSNTYQWKRNNNTVASATTDTYSIASLDRNSMGDYLLEVTNPKVPGVTLQSFIQTVLATSDLSGKLFADAQTPASKGTVTLFRVTSSNGYDTLAIKNVNKDGSFNFSKVVLDNYQVLGFADTLIYTRALPTYYKKTTLWEEADTIRLEKSLSDLNIISEVKPGTTQGNGVISGVVEQDDGKAGRTKKATRVAAAGVSARKVENTGRDKEEKLTLVAYVFSDANGEFVIPNLPQGNYRINIQYPGYPMDESSYINIPIAGGLESQVRVEATVAQGQISVRKVIITGISGAEAYSAEVFPNPTSSYLHMKFASASAGRIIRMTDNSGRQVGQHLADTQSVTLDIRALPSGSYVFQVMDREKTVKSLHIVIE